MANVPQELVSDILLWLPVKSLLRFRCVSKSLCAIIRSKSFIDSHFKNTCENRIHRKLIDLGVHKADDDRLKIHALAFNDDFQQELVLDKPVPSKLYPYIFSHCNGLVLLCILPRKLSVWNPSTRKYRILPAFPVKYARSVSFGLGYDSIADDYKAVVIISKKGWDTTQVWIFELRSSCWRRIQDFPYGRYNSIENGGNGDCFVDGSMHFICHDRDELVSYIIVAFDVAKETFSIVYEPFFIFQPEDIPTRLHVFGGYISICYCSFIAEKWVNIYVMKEMEIMVGLSKLYSVTEENKFSNEVFECFTEGRVAYSKEGDKVFFSSNGKLCSYDFKEKTLQEILTKNTYHLDIFSCIDNLASVGL